MTNPTPRDSAQLPPLRKLTEDELSTLHDNPNTSDVEQLVYDYAREALRAQAASVPVDRGHLSDLRYVLNVLKKMGAQDEVGHGDVLAAIVGMNYVIARTEAAPQPQAVVASSPATAVDAVRVTALKRAAEDAVSAMNPRHGPFIDAVANPLLIIELCAALQASRQTHARQAVAEGAGGGLRQTLIDVGRMIAWQCFGDCRAYDEFGPGSLRGLHEMDAEIRAALATKEPK